MSDAITAPGNQAESNDLDSQAGATALQGKQSSSSLNKSEGNKASDVDEKQSAEDNACVVCFKPVDIYSIGECDHPVCYECSTRMRVLCQQNECPICRQVLSKVIFTYDKLSYRELEAKNRSEYYSKKYKISFYNNAIQQKFFELLDHPCPVCNCPPYRTFQGLRNHVRREHDLHYCDLCTDNLKIFTFERKCYTQTELGLHRAKGDPDNRSHRGHPLCEYCNKRYLDRDELFRHLRREHYFCHFCDADGCNEFYKDYEALADHFRQDHYLCEEGRCATEQFIGAFRSEIDYKAHVATVHGNTLNKQQAKQTRTLQLEITLGRRGQRGQNDQHILGMRSRRGGNDNQYHEEPPEYMTSQMNQMHQHQSQPQQQAVIDAASEQEFPALAGVANGPNVSLVRPPPPSMRNRSVISGLARTKENFPELGSSGGGGSVKPSSSNQPPGNSASSLIRKAPPGSPGASTSSGKSSLSKQSNGMVIHVSNRPSTSTNASNQSKKQSMMDFPALPSGKNKKSHKFIDDDDLPSPSNQVPLGNVATKHRPLINEYVSVANPSNFQKIQMIQKEDAEAKARKAAELARAPKLTALDFPSLGPSSAPVSNASNGSSKGSLANWNKPMSEKKQRDLENRKTKVAAPPLLPINNKQHQTQAQPQRNVLVNSNNSNEQNKKDKKGKEKKNSPDPPLNSNKNGNNNNNSIGSSNKTKEKTSNNNETKALNLNNSSNNLNKSSSSSSNSLKAPPGFKDSQQQQQQSLKPPPGFQTNVTVNSVAKSPNNLTFTTSLGESYSITPSHVYNEPPNFANRNQELVAGFREALSSSEAMEEFRHLSQKFREGTMKPQAYYEHCEAALKSKFNTVFPELLALLPDINKQQTLYLVHQQNVNSMPASQRKSLPNFEVCSVCKQVLLPSDVSYHKKSHLLDENFPSLEKPSSTAITRK